MNKIVRWNRIDPTTVFDEFERVFNRSVPRWNNDEWSVALDVAENEDAYVVKASLPGINAEDVKLTIEDNVLSIKGEMKADETMDEGQYHVRERRSGSFSRSIRFPVLVNGDAVEATFENGVLTLTVPKAEEVKPKRIEIKAG
ncbi:MAG: Hsp20/alpha crystallin family protein [Chloroflexi bacterium]|nr:Hsp20/alpha crystallin family protein [Chloroflexota bacterium]